MLPTELEALSTKQLLARLRRLRQCEESLARSDQEVESSDAAGTIRFKQSPEWVVAYKQLKAVLARREHVPKGFELLEKRDEKARQGKGRDRKLGKHRKP